MIRTFRRSIGIALAALLCGAVVTPVDAADRNRARTSVSSSRSTSRSTHISSERNVNRDVNVNRERNVNIDRDVDIDVDRDIDIDVDRRGCCYHSGWGTAAAVATTAVVTAAVVGTRVYALPPSCTLVSINGLTYQQCGSTWYQPQFYGTTTSYIVVTAPR